MQVREPTMAWSVYGRRMLKLPDKNKVAHLGMPTLPETRGGHVPPLTFYGGDLVRIINIICIAISLIVFAGGAVILGIRCLKMHDDALLHPPDPNHIQWPDEEGDDL